ncbi:MAG: hypothetical protein ACJ77K_09895 [Bacteroidia bacterium]
MLSMHRTSFIFACLIVLCCGFTSLLHERSNETIHAKDANRYMWDQLHQGNYDSIQQIITQLKTAWYQSPDDAKLNTHLGFIYLWKFCERGRKDPDPLVFQNIFTSNFFFKRAIELNPDDARLYSLQAATEICEGAIRKDVLKISKGYRTGHEAVGKWPQFNRFALAAIESMMDKNSSLFHEGLRYQWITMDECSCKHLSKKEILKHPDKVISGLIDELQNSTDPKIKRACWNSWIAPHNFEGYLLNFGDMLVKQGKLEEAKKVYTAIKLAPSYSEWVYKTALEKRITDVSVNEKLFNRKLNLLFDKGEPQIFINSQISCVACHQMNPEEFKRYGYQEPGDETYSIDRRTRPGS